MVASDYPSLLDVHSGSTPERPGRTRGARGRGQWRAWDEAAPDDPRRPASPRDGAAPAGDRPAPGRLPVHHLPPLAAGPAGGHRARHSPPAGSSPRWRRPSRSAACARRSWSTPPGTTKRRSCRPGGAARVLRRDDSQPGEVVGMEPTPACAGWWTLCPRPPGAAEVKVALRGGRRSRQREHTPSYAWPPSLRGRSVSLPPRLSAPSYRQPRLRSGPPGAGGGLFRRVPWALWALSTVAPLLGGGSCLGACPQVGLLSSTSSATSSCFA